MQRQVFSVAFEFLKKLCRRIPSNSNPFDSLMVKINGCTLSSFGRAFIASLERTRIACDAPNSTFALLSLDPSNIISKSCPLPDLNKTGLGPSFIPLSGSSLSIETGKYRFKKRFNRKRYLKGNKRESHTKRKRIANRILHKILAKSGVLKSSKKEDSLYMKPFFLIKRSSNNIKPQ